MRLARATAGSLVPGAVLTLYLVGCAASGPPNGDPATVPGAGADAGSGGSHVEVEGGSSAQPADAATDSGARTASGPCGGSPVFCDDFSSGGLASAYTPQNGTWVRSTGSYAVTDSNAWGRARSTLGYDVTDFNVTVSGQPLGDYGFGLIYAAHTAQNGGYAVLVHPAQFQSIYLKKLVVGQADVDIASAPLASNLAGQPMTLRVTR